MKALLCDGDGLQRVDPLLLLARARLQELGMLEGVAGGSVASAASRLVQQQLCLGSAARTHVLSRELVATRSRNAGLVSGADDMLGHASPFRVVHLDKGRSHR